MRKILEPYQFFFSKVDLTHKFMNGNDHIIYITYFYLTRVAKNHTMVTAEVTDLMNSRRNACEGGHLDARKAKQSNMTHRVLRLDLDREGGRVDCDRRSTCALYSAPNMVTPLVVEYHYTIDKQT